MDPPDATPPPPDTSPPDAMIPDAMMPEGALGPCPPSGDCDDDSRCNGTIECRDGWCFPGDAPIVCDDGVDCTVDRCTEPHGTCVNEPDPSVCEDGNDCTVDACGEAGCERMLAADGVVCGGGAGACLGGDCCTGCVDEAGGCQPGTVISACGAAGVACSACPCASDRCESAGCPPDYLRVVQVVTGEYHTCARTLSGELYCWGRNIHGQLGTGDNTSRRRPSPVGMATDWVDISTLNAHVCGIRLSEGRRTLYCWGFGTSGQLGTNRAVNQNTPQPVMTDRSDWRDLSVGQFHSCARTAAGQIFCWGSDASGQLGIPGSEGSLVPVQLEMAGSLASGWLSVSAGGEHTCAVRRPLGTMEGILYCWGGGSVGALGLGDRLNRDVPSQLLGTTWARAVMGFRHSCALQESGHLACWGLNRSGEAGVADETFVLMPRGVDATTNWIAVSLNGSAPPFIGGNTCGVKADGTLWCWGTGSGGRLGMGPSVTDDLSRPTQVGTATDWYSVSVGGRHACAVKRDGTLWCWGDGSSGQLGNNDVRMRTVPTRVCFPE